MANPQDEEALQSTMAHRDLSRGPAIEPRNQVEDQETNARLAKRVRGMKRIVQTPSLLDPISPPPDNTTSLGEPLRLPNGPLGRHVARLQAEPRSAQENRAASPTDGLGIRTSGAKKQYIPGKRPAVEKNHKTKPTPVKLVQQKRQELAAGASQPSKKKRRAKHTNTISPNIRANIKKHQFVSYESQQGYDPLNRGMRNPLETVSINQLPWLLLPAGTRITDQVAKYYTDISRSQKNFAYDTSRLEFLARLNPVQCYIGLNEFNSYVVFLFANTEKIILESPKIGNATYILTGDWKRLCRLSKSDLLNIGQPQATRIIHKGDWQSKLKLAIQAKRPIQ